MAEITEGPCIDAECDDDSTVNVVTPDVTISKTADNSPILAGQGDTSDDIAIICPKTTLAAGEAMTCSATLPVGIGLRVNIATLTANPDPDPEGKVSDTDDAVIRVPEPEVTPTPTPSGTVEDLTLPPTSTVDAGTTGTAGNGLLFILISLAGPILAAG